MKEQRGMALLLVLIFLAAGAVLLTPTLNYTATSLMSHRVSQESTEVRYALDAITQQALWMMEYYDDANPFQDCDEPPDLVGDSFAKCVAMKGSWTLTTQALPTPTPYTIVDRVNNQDVAISVEVPSALTAPPEPTPTPSSEHCIYVWVTRDTDPDTPGDQTWAESGEPIEYTLHFWNCDGKSTKLRRVVALLPPGFDYLSEDEGYQGTGPPQPEGITNQDPEESVCTGLAQPYYGCKENDSSLLLDWPSATTNFAGETTVTLGPGESRILGFQAVPSTWGVFYVEANVCFFAATSGDPGPCTTGNMHNSGKVAPVVVGMFNIQGKGKGQAYGASAKLDSGGSDLISQQPK